MGASPEQNRLLYIIIRRTYFPCFFGCLAVCINPLVDLLLATALVAKDGNNGFFGLVGLSGASAVAAIGIASPVLMCTGAFLLAIVSGCSARFNEYLGRGDPAKSQSTFVLAFWSIVALGLCFAAVMFFFPSETAVFAGAGDSASLLYYTASYLKYAGLSVVFTGLSALYASVLGSYGHQKSVLFGNVLNVVLNFFFSVFFYVELGKRADIGIGALGMGTAAASLVSLLVFVLQKNRHRIKIRPKRYRANHGGLRHAGLTFTHDLSYCAALLISAFSARLVNRIILSASCWAKFDVAPSSVLAVYAVVNSLYGLAQVSGNAITQCTGPMVGIFFGSGDRSAARSLFTRAVGCGILTTFLWILILYVFAPVFAAFYSLGSKVAQAVVLDGMLVTLPFAFISMFLSLLASFYDLTDHLFMYLCVTVLPGCVFFPLAILFLLNATDLGLDGVWLSIGGCGVLFLIALVAGIALHFKKFPFKTDDFLLLSKGKCGDYPMLETSVGTDAESISRETEKVHAFLSDEKISKRNSYFLTLCIDELLNDIRLNARGLKRGFGENDRIVLKILSEDSCVRVILSNFAEPYNPLLFDTEADDPSKIGIRMVQNIADDISYGYLYKMNRISFSVSKEARS